LDLGKMDWIDWIWVTLHPRKHSISFGYDSFSQLFTEYFITKHRMNANGTSHWRICLFNQLKTVKVRYTSSMHEIVHCNKGQSKQTCGVKVTFLLSLQFYLPGCLDQKTAK